MPVPIRPAVRGSRTRIAGALGATAAAGANRSRIGNALAGKATGALRPNPLNAPAAGQNGGAGGAPHPNGNGNGGNGAHPGNGGNAGNGNNPGGAGKNGNGKGKGAPPTTPPAPWYSGPQSLPEAKGVANAEAGTVYNPVREDLRGEGRASANREKQIGEWYSGLNSQIQGNAVANEAASAAANAALQKQLETTGQASAAQQASNLQGDTQFANVVGAPGNAFAIPQQTAAAAATQRGYTQTALAAPIIQAGASQGDYLRNEAANARHQGIQAKGEEASRRQTIQQKLQSLQHEKGEAKVKDLNALKEAGQTNATNEEADRIKRAAFHLEGKEAETSAVQGAQKLALEREAEKMAVREAAEGKSQREIENAEKGRQLEIEEGKLKNEDTTTKAAAQKAAAEAADGGLTPHEVAELKEEKVSAAEGAKDALQKYEANGIKIQTPAQWHELAENVAKEHGISLAIASKAVAKLHEETARTNALANSLPNFGP